MEKAYNSDEYKKFMNERGFGMRLGRTGGSHQMVAEDDASLGNMMTKAGLAK